MALVPPSSFLRDVNVRSAISDFRVVFEQARGKQWRIILASAAMTIGIFSVMWQEGGRGLPPRPTVTYITSWRADRTMEEIVASNIANQKRKDQLAAEQARREEEVRNIYKKIGRMSGMDVEAIEKQAAAEKAAKEQAEKARAEKAAAAPSGQPGTVAQPEASAPPVHD